MTYGASVITASPLFALFAAVFLWFAVVDSNWLSGFWGIIYLAAFIDIIYTEFRLRSRNDFL